MWADAGEPVMGQVVTRKDDKGEERNYRITAADAESVTVDGNHPLAGRTLRFRGTVVAVRAISPEELAAH
jgi:FKBP-type peptidyl-prolyl cis-trans isomerase SlyD